MNTEIVSQLQAMQTVTQNRLDNLVQELSKRARVVNEESISHLIERGVIARMAQDGCCKPDGGTCCPNAKRQIVTNPIKSL
ncbi:hypothetical protein [Ideonella sp.]|jgi:hypothetical protein|uniref:hypothetical protein n=1 Tax=Ideonella sp. TaxID=1929293 RepID=UPI0037C020EE